MDAWRKKIEVRWSDLDPNFHLRHSAYYDYAATMRVEFLHRYGITPAYLKKHSIGPVILREECIFLKEIASGDAVIVDMQLKKARRDYSRWTFHHRIFKNDDVLAANLTLDGGWLDVNLRKLCIPPVEVVEAFKALPLDENFEWDEKISKPSL